ncbi:hypothetical protein AMS68_007911 [Peltaster fructicola]|uniref:ADP-ribosylation factor n=1 Tax=Peltaster fructicola TaxID=286661 RepID=A0A6H0Y5U8_9PEZI|nr:hypothetical protein AMS68_007911 [Peltaster fructicola]
MGSSQPAFDTQEEAQTLKDYCEHVSNDSRDIFVNLDDVAALPGQMHQISDPRARDFAVLFDDSVVYAGFDLSIETYQHILSLASRPAASTCWVNIWFPSQHLELLETIGKRYDFSPRLLALMCSSSIPHTTTSSLRSQAVPSTHSSWFVNHKTKVSVDEESITHESLDMSSVSSQVQNTQNNIYRLADEIWHYSSMDFGRNYICVGYNSLYGVTPLLEQSRGVERHLPSCTRAWTWLIICDDNTIITINEDIFPQAHLAYSAKQLQVLCETRHNLVNVFRSLSLVDSDPLEARNPMRLLPIRARLGTTEAENVHHESDAPGLLFYYLFENWQNSYTLITRKESRYGLELERLRHEMFVKPRLEHIERLHTIGQELGVLKRHYDSYTRIIDRLLEPRPPTLASLQNSRVADQEDDAHSIDTVRPLLMAKESSLGVSISTATRMRFRRLKDLIDLYALSEVDEYLTQKESLVSLNFNLLTLKESLDVERLTRITLLLTKATFLFLPVSFMTSYFSVPLSAQEYTVLEYWATFGAILLLSFAALFIFGLISGSAETTAVINTIMKCFKRSPHK